MSDNPSGMKCEACRSIGYAHCSDPEHCGNMKSEMDILIEKLLVTAPEPFEMPNHRMHRYQLERYEAANAIRALVIERDVLKLRAADAQRSVDRMDKVLSDKFESDMNFAQKYVNDIIEAYETVRKAWYHGYDVGFDHGKGDDGEGFEKGNGYEPIIEEFGKQFDITGIPGLIGIGGDSLLGNHNGIMDDETFDDFVKDLK